MTSIPYLAERRLDNFYLSGLRMGFTYPFFKILTPYYYVIRGRPYVLCTS